MGVAEVSGEMYTKGNIKKFRNWEELNEVGNNVRDGGREMGEYVREGKKKAHKSFRSNFVGSKKKKGKYRRPGLISTSILPRGL